MRILAICGGLREESNTLAERFRNTKRAPGVKALWYYWVGEHNNRKTAIHSEGKIDETQKHRQTDHRSRNNH
jgi:hypothetical protein